MEKHLFFSFVEMNSMNIQIWINRMRRVQEKRTHFNVEERLWASFHDSSCLDSMYGTLNMYVLHWKLFSDFFLSVRALCVVRTPFFHFLLPVLISRTMFHQVELRVKKIVAVPENRFRVEADSCIVFWIRMWCVFVYNVLQLHPPRTLI